MIELIVLLLAIVIVIILYKIFKATTKLVINSILGIIMLFLTNYVIGLCNLGFSIDINIITVLLCAIAGIPGLILVIILAYLNVPFV
ncbi:MAG: pro-sigmaK processing inhibitor BofA family protein [Methanosarcinales archaeon]|nr:pro-sigmaK processing inhibitor BofA family protein [Methanosarcinales archaeon]